MESDQTISSRRRTLRRLYFYSRILNHDFCDALSLTFANYFVGNNPLLHPISSYLAIPQQVGKLEAGRFRYKVFSYMRNFEYVVVAQFKIHLGTIFYQPFTQIIFPAKHFIDYS